jgi:hypothetical protein
MDRGATIQIHELTPASGAVWYWGFVTGWRHTRPATFSSHGDAPLVPHAPRLSSIAPCHATAPGRHQLADGLAGVDASWRPRPASVHAFEQRLR